MSCFSKTVFFLLKVGAGAYALFCVLIFLLQDKMIYFPGREVLAVPSDIGLEYEKVFLLAKDGVRLSAWHMPRESARGTALICHGNGGNIGDRLHAISLFHELGLNVLIFDYRGYGESGGVPSEEGTYLDAEAAWKYLVEENKTPSARVFVCGRSLGGAVAAALAERFPVGGLILEATFTSVPDIAERLYPWLPVRLLCRFRYGTLERMGKIRCPVLVAHSKEDGIIPFEHGRRLFEAANEPKGFVELTGGHNEGEVMISPGYREALVKFLEEASESPQVQASNSFN